MPKPIEEAVQTIVRFYQQSKSENSLWLNREYRQGLRDALEALKRAGVIKEYDLRGEGKSANVQHRKHRS